MLLLWSALFLNMPSEGKITREQIIENAEEYRNLEWQMYSRNYLKQCTKPVYIKTPFKSDSTITIAGMPYCWGGGSTIDKFTQAIADSGKAGNICTTLEDGKTRNTYQGNTYGVDCSGFVTRVWELNEEHRGTTQLQSYCEVIEDSPKKNDRFDKLKMGDIIIKPKAHVYLFYKINTKGEIEVFHSTTGDNNKIVFDTIPLGKLNGYVTWRYKYVDDQKK